MIQYPFSRPHNINLGDAPELVESLMESIDCEYISDESNDYNAPLPPAPFNAEEFLSTCFDFAAATVFTTAEVNAIQEHMLLDDWTVV